MDMTLYDLTLALSTVRRHAESHRASAGSDAYSAQEAPRLEHAHAVLLELVAQYTHVASLPPNADDLPPPQRVQVEVWQSIDHVWVIGRAENLHLLRKGKDGLIARYVIDNTNTLERRNLGEQVRYAMDAGQCVITHPY